MAISIRREGASNSCEVISLSGVWHNGGMALRSQAGKVIWWLIPVIALACLPPQRLSGDWTDENGNSVPPSSETLELDRYMFGYAPRFKPVHNIGRPEPEIAPNVTTVSTPHAGPYKYASKRWVIDWPWIGGISVMLAIGAVTHALLEWTKLAGQSAASGL